VKTKSFALAKVLPRNPVPVLSVAPGLSLTTRTESLVVARVTTVVPVPPSFRGDPHEHELAGEESRVTGRLVDEPALVRPGRVGGERAVVAEVRKACTRRSDEVASRRGEDGVACPVGRGIVGGGDHLVVVPIRLAGQELGEPQPARERNAVAVDAADALHEPGDDNRRRDSNPKPTTCSVSGEAGPLWVNVIRASRWSVMRG
jgi:hypothetical protein